jgi:uncharacterized membrane protein
MSDVTHSDGRWNIALIVSLCLNFLLAGVILTAVLRFALHKPEPFFHGAPPPMAAGMERGQMHAMLSPRTLMRAAPEKRDAIFAVIGKHHGRIDALRAGSMAARQEVMRLFSQDKLDRPALDKALTQMQQADAALETEILSIVSETAIVLTPQERRAAAEAAKHGRGHGGGFGGGWRHHGGPDGPDGPGGPPGEGPGDGPPPPPPGR